MLLRYLPGAARRKESREVTQLHPQLENALAALQERDAQFAEYKRRAAKLLAAASTTGQVQVLEQILPLLDDLQMAHACMPASLKGDPWLQGLGLIHHNFVTALTHVGVQRFGRAGELFDPH
jgi:molecular chaperone GrpE (heat shock protein)